MVRAAADNCVADGSIPSASTTNNFACSFAIAGNQISAVNNIWPWVPMVGSSTVYAVAAGSIPVMVANNIEIASMIQVMLAVGASTVESDVLHS